MKPVRRPLRNGCEMCIYRVGDFSIDEKDTKVIRCFCRARFCNVDSELMVSNCDFYVISPDKVPDKKEDNYGL